MCELQHPLVPGKVGMHLGFSQSESGRLYLRMNGASCPLNFVEVNPLTPREWIHSLLWQDRIFLSLGTFNSYYPSQNLSILGSEFVFMDHALLRIIENK